MAAPVCGRKDALFTSRDSEIVIPENFVYCIYDISTEVQLQSLGLPLVTQMDPSRLVHTLSGPEWDPSISDSGLPRSCGPL